MSARYDTDFYSWAQEQAAALRRAGAERVNTSVPIDWQNLAEEVDGMGQEQADKLESAYRVLLMHLLKWQFQPERRSTSWRLGIVEQRRRAVRLLDRNPGLKPRREALWRDAYEDARELAGIETELGEAAFPVDCPYALDNALDASFWPGGPESR